MKKIFAAILICSTAACFGPFPPSQAKIAEGLRKEGKLSESIAAYRKHIEDRFNDERRKTDENPNFYHLLIGDIYLEEKQPLMAESEYKIALKKEIEQGFLTYRFRELALYYEKIGNFEDAVRVLKEYRKLDELLFDGTLDEVHKREIAKEDLLLKK